MGKDKNNKQDLAILSISKDIEFIKCEITDIKTNHLHSINGEIRELNKEISNLKDELNRRPTWFITFIISLCMALIAFILGNFLI